MLRKAIVTFVIILLVLIVAAGTWLWTPDRDRALLEAKYSNNPSDFINVLGVRLHVRDSGPKTAPAVIMVHGLGSSLHTWEGWAPSLSRDYRTIRFDLPGAGLSSTDPTGDYTDARSVQIMTALMNQLEVARATVIGSSIGGRIGWRFAAEEPARVDKLVLVSPDGFESRGFEYGKPPDVPSIIKLMRYMLPASLLRLNLQPAYADPKALNDDTVTRYHELMLAPGVRDALIARMEQTILQDPVPLLRRIEAPTLLLWGEQDRMIPISNANDYVGALKRSTFVRLPGVGHVPQEESPTRSLEPVVAFLKN